MRRGGNASSAGRSTLADSHLLLGHGMQDSNPRSRQSPIAVTRTYGLPSPWGPKPVWSRDRDRDVRWRHSDRDLLPLIEGQVMLRSLLRPRAHPRRRTGCTGAPPTWWPRYPGRPCVTSHQLAAVPTPDPAGPRSDPEPPSPVPSTTSSSELQWCTDLLNFRRFLTEPDRQVALQGDVPFGPSRSLRRDQVRSGSPLHQTCSELQPCTGCHAT